MPPLAPPLAPPLTLTHQRGKHQNIFIFTSFQYIFKIYTSQEFCFGKKKEKERRMVKEFMK